MIEAHQFFDHASRYGYTFYTGVPCSFLTPFINYTINSTQFDYISATNEGDAVAMAAGAGVGGIKAVAMMQNSGLGNAINPLTSLTYSFRIPVLLIITLRGDQQLADEPQHELMGKITGTLLDSVDISWEYFPTEHNAIEPAMGRAEAHMTKERLPFAFIMRKGSVAPQKLEGNQNSRLSQRSLTKVRVRCINKDSDTKLSRSEALSCIVEHTQPGKNAIIATTGFTGRELFALTDRPNQLYMVGSMGCASSFGLGLSLARPDLHIIVIDGDGAALMRMGNFATIGAYGGPNFTHILLDNGVHDSTGGQATTSPGLSFAEIAATCGYTECLEGGSLELLDRLLTDRGGKGPRFGHLRIRSGTSSNLPRPNLRPDQVRERLMDYIGSSTDDIKI